MLDLPTFSNNTRQQTPKFYMISPIFCPTMLRHFPSIFMCLVISSSCGTNNRANITDKSAAEKIGASAATEPAAEPDYNYIIRLGPGWGMFDTVLNDQQLRAILAPAHLDMDKPRGNIVIANMSIPGIDEFTTANENTLKRDMPGVILLKEGKMAIGGIDARWFTYSKTQDGIARDMINYIIPSNGFAYMITFGTNAGTMGKYLPAFDNMVRTFRVNAYDKPDTTGLSDTAALLLSDTSSRYMETGFYDVVDRHNGVRMHKEHSDELYYLKNTPFASVNHVVKARLFRHRLNGTIVPELDLSFDESGTKALRGIGTPLHSTIAVVIANRLLYVITDAEAIQKGEMLISLENYSEDEVESMLNAVLHKR